MAALGSAHGAYIEGMDFPANPVKSAYIPEEVFSLVVRATNGHGADNQRGVLDRLCAEYNAEGERFVEEAARETAADIREWLALRDSGSRSRGVFP